MGKKLILIGSLICLIFIPATVFAVPHLGVATSTRVYNYDGDTPPTDEYIDYFTDLLLPSTGDYHGFVVGASGSSLIVFTQYSPGTELYLLATTGSNDLSLTFDGEDMVAMPEIGKIDGYNARPYYGINISSGPWETETNLFGSTTYYLYEAPITYQGSWEEGYYFFAYAPGKTPYFSPKTDSASYGHTPEPATLVLMGTGLLGLLGIGIRRRKS